MSKHRLQFSLRSLLLLVFLIASVCSLAKWFGPEFFLRMFRIALQPPIGELFVPLVFATVCGAGTWMFARRCSLSPRPDLGWFLLSGSVLLQVAADAYLGWARFRLVICRGSIDPGAPWMHPDQLLLGLYNYFEYQNPSPPVTYNGQWPHVWLTLEVINIVLMGCLGACAGPLFGSLPRSRNRQAATASDRSHSTNFARRLRWALGFTAALMLGFVLMTMERTRRQWEDEARWAKAGASTTYRRGRLVGLYFNTLTLSGRSYHTSQLNDEFLDQLQGLNDLEALALSHSDVTDAGLKRLPEAKHLRWLILDGTKITDEGLREIARFKNLTKLDLDRTKVTDDGLQHLQALPELEILSLEETTITDASVGALTKLRHLEYLNIENTEISDDGRQRIRDALTHCSIY